jgi:hypothetical protein
VTSPVSGIRWYVFGEALIGEVRAPDLPAAQAAAWREYGSRAYRVQSAASVELDALELPRGAAEKLYGKVPAGHARSVVVPAKKKR